MKEELYREKKASEIIMGVLEILPRRLSSEILRVCCNRRDFPLGLSEIRVRCNGRSAIVLSGENIPLFTALTQTEIADIYDRAAGGSIYSHTEEIKRGFISMPRGVRVGISGSLPDSSSVLTDVSTLVFRIPASISESAGALFSIWQKNERRGMLIYSSPGGGKTSALRAIAGIISRELLLRVAVIDERREFVSDDYKDCAVDILKGFDKARGIECAMRTLSPEVIIIDEIGNFSECEALLAVGRGGIPIIATAHADSFSEVTEKASIRPLCSAGYFGIFVRLYKENGRFKYESRISDLKSASVRAISDGR